MELMASESSELLLLSMQQESIHCNNISNHSEKITIDLENERRKQR